MRIYMAGQGFQITEALRAHVDQRLRFALSRFGGRIGRVSTRLVSCQGPHGGAEVRCCLTVQVIDVQQIRVEVADADVRVAVDSAIDRAERFVALALSSARDDSTAWGRDVLLPVGSHGSSKASATLMRRRGRDRRSREVAGASTLILPRRPTD